MSTETIKILLSIACIPVLLLLVGGGIYAYYSIYKWVIGRIAQVRQLRVQYAKDTNLYKEVLTSSSYTDKNMQEKVEKVENEFKKLVWGRLLFLVEEHYIITAFIAAIIVAALFVLVMIIYESVISSCCNCCEPYYITSNERIVLAFVGILATFVVLTNHAQSVERIRILEKILKDTEIKLNETIDNQKKQNEELLQAKINESTSQHMLRTFKFVDACRDQNSYSVSKNILDTAQEDEKNRTSKNYKIRLTDGNELNATISISKDNIQFVRLDTYAAIPHELIKSINGDDCDIQKVCTIVLTLRQLYYNNEKQ